MPGTFKVASLSTAKRVRRRFDAVLTIEDPGIRNGLRFHSAPHPDHLILMFEDVDDFCEGIALPHERHVRAALAFGREHARGSLLIHCRAGVARSAAMALAILADRAGPGAEDKAVAQLLENRPVSIPNLIVLSMADSILGRNGRLSDAWNRIESSNRKYAEHRTLKRQILERNPSLYAQPRPLDSTARRFAPHAMTWNPGLLPEDSPATPVLEI